MANQLNGKDILEYNQEALSVEIAGFNAVPSADSGDNTSMAEVIGNKTDTTGGDSIVSLVKGGASCSEVIEEAVGASIIGRAVTAILFVSPNGDNSDGSSWSKAFNTIQGALAVASTDVNECTLIMVGINTGANYYDINTTGDPTFTGNYIIKGTHRTWQKIKNDHVGATSIMKFSGNIELHDLNFNLGIDNNGVIITKGASRVISCQFTGEDLTSPATALHYKGATLIKHGILRGCTFRGEATNTNMTGILIENSCYSKFEDFQMHNNFTGVQIINVASDENVFKDADIGDGEIGFDIDAGNGQRLINILFHKNDTMNIDDEVGDHHYQDIKGEFPITIEPIDGVNYAGVTVAAGEDTWGADVELRAAATSLKPFKILGYKFEPSEEKKFIIRFSADSEVTFFNMAMTDVKKDKANGISAGTDFVFNAGTRISCSAGCEEAGKNIQIWLDIQEI